MINKQKTLLPMMSLALILSIVASACSKNPEPEPVATSEPAIEAGQDTPQVTEGIVLADQTVYFEFDKANVSDSELEKVQAVANYLKQDDDVVVKIKIEGHTDERGAPDYNMVLGQRRAESVYDLLIAYGVKESQLEVVSYGEEFPAERGQTDAAYAKNRRVVFVEVSK